MLATAGKFGVRFSITARQDKRVRAAIDAIPDQAWQPIPYWLSTPEVSGADIAETAFTVFAGDKRHARQVRLVVRRVRPTSDSQLALFTAWDYHAFVTDRYLPLAAVEADQRRHEIVEQTFAELEVPGWRSDVPPHTVPPSPRRGARPRRRGRSRPSTGGNLVHWSTGQVLLPLLVRALVQRGPELWRLTASESGSPVRERPGRN